MIQTITIMGRIGQNAVVKPVGDKKVITFSIACTNRVKQADVTTWYNCELWRSEGLAQYLTKGTLVTVVGQFRLGYYTTIHEEIRVDPRIIVDHIGLGGSKQDPSSQQQATAVPVGKKPSPMDEEWADIPDPF